MALRQLLIVARSKSRFSSMLGCRFPLDVIMVEKSSGSVQAESCLPNISFRPFTQSRDMTPIADKESWNHASSDSIKPVTHTYPPSWLPLVPGSSYWVPQESEVQQSQSDIILSDEEAMATIATPGWPSFPGLIKGQKALFPCICSFCLAKKKKKNSVCPAALILPPITRDENTTG